MAISIVNSTSNTSTSGTSHVGTAPSGIADNDILVGAVLVDSATDSCTWPTGWAEWQKELGLDAYSVVRVGWKRCSSESGDYTWTLPSGYKYSVITAVRGCKTSGDPAHVTPSNTEYRTSNTTIRGAAVTTTVECAMLWVAGIAANGTITAPGTYTKADNEADPGYYDLHIAYKLAVASGTIGPIDGTGPTTTNKHAFLVALEPAAAAVKHPLMMMGVG